MSQEQYVTKLKQELEKLNKEIDVKIVYGQSYSSEAKKHRVLLTEIRKHSARNFWNKLFPKFSF